MRMATVATTVLAAGILWTSPAMAQHEEHGGMMMPETGLRAAVIHDIEEAEEKVMSLAEAMKDHWDWRPAEGVRSVGEVYGHIAAANMLIPTLFGIMPPEEFQGADQGETMGNLMAIEQMSADEIMEHLGHSFMHARHAVARVPDDRLDEVVQYFGQEGPVSQVMVLFVTHTHEHLGQSIAYARTNGVVPPWSQGGM